MIEFEGVVRNVERRFKETTSDYVREQMENTWHSRLALHVKGIV